MPCLRRTKPYQKDFQSLRNSLFLYLNFSFYFRNYTFGTLLVDDDEGHDDGFSDAALDEFQQLLAVLRNFNR